jgi:hydroxymethylpyrimidine/phosphomethylpyrimidine kinase
VTSRPPTALTIAGSDSGGGAGLQADLKTFLACRVHGMSAVTAVTVQNSLGLSGFYELPPHAVAEQIESVVSDIGVGAAKTGMLASAQIMAAVAQTVHRLGVTPFVVDPVAASQHGDPLLRPDAIAALRELIIPLATIVTPNLGEAALLTGREVRSPADMADAARALHALGPKWVLVKGGHLDSGDAVDLLYDGTDFVELTARRFATLHTHGSGDTLAAAITAALARGLGMVDAVREGKRFITAAVQGSFALGKGRGPVGHFWRVRDWP